MEVRLDERRERGPLSLERGSLDQVLSDRERGESQLTGFDPLDTVEPHEPCPGAVEQGVPVVGRVAGDDYPIRVRGRDELRQPAFVIGIGVISVDRVYVDPFEADPR